MAFACVSIVQAQTAAKHAMTFDDLIAMQRVSEPQISPDGRSVAYTVGTAEMESNRVARNIWVISTAPGSQPRQLTQSGHDTRPQWSPDGKTIAFVSSREGASQVYVMSAQGGNHFPFDRRGQRKMVAGRPIDRLHVERLSRLRG
jgi:dipeptidyl aminopeptidase/acylaminoacyl peptidase